MHHAEILIGHFREMVRNWPVTSCYFVLCGPLRQILEAVYSRDSRSSPVCSVADEFDDVKIFLLGSSLLTVAGLFH